MKFKPGSLVLCISNHSLMGKKLVIGKLYITRKHHNDTDGWTSLEDIPKLGFRMENFKKITTSKRMKKYLKVINA